LSILGSHLTQVHENLMTMYTRPDHFEVSRNVLDSETLRILEAAQFRNFSAVVTVIMKPNAFLSEVDSSITLAQSLKSFELSPSNRDFVFLVCWIRSIEAERPCDVTDVTRWVHSLYEMHQTL
jgi:hypothetical protein